MPEVKACPPSVWRDQRSGIRGQWSEVRDQGSWTFKSFTKNNLSYIPFSDLYRDRIGACPRIDELVKN